MLISLKKILIPWLYSILKRHLYKKQKDWGSQMVVWVLVGTKYLSFP